MNVEIANKIKTIVTSMLPDARVLLFGSHARGDVNKHSDYDLLIITPQAYPPRENRQWRAKLNKALVYALNAPFDVLLNSDAEVQIKQSLPGHIVRTALKEGKEL